jgi:sulfonate transport system substrate-binding protein
MNGGVFGGRLNTHETKTLGLASTLILVAITAACSRTPAGKPQSIRLDYAYYNPMSLVLKDKKFLEQDLASDGISVEWTQSLGSNKALELLNSKSVDFGSTAGPMGIRSKRSMCTPVLNGRHLSFAKTPRSQK